MSNQDFIMYFIVNSDLNMSKGKIASQVAHAACDLTNHYLLNGTKDERIQYKKYRQNGQPKIILKSTTLDMFDLFGLFLGILNQCELILTS